MRLYRLDMDESNFFKATGTLPTGAWAGFEIGVPPNDDVANIWCGVNAWGGNTGVYGECFQNGSPFNSGKRGEGLHSVGVCGRADGFGILGQGALCGGKFGGIDDLNPPGTSITGVQSAGELIGVTANFDSHQAPGLMGIASDGLIDGIRIGLINQPINGARIDATDTGVQIGEVMPPSTGVSIQAKHFGLEIGQDPGSAKPDIGALIAGDKLGVGVVSDGGDGVQSFAPNGRAGTFTTALEAQIRLVPNENDFDPLPAGEAGDLLVRAIPDVEAPKNQTKIFLCLGKQKNGMSLWAPLSLGPTISGL